MPNELKNFLESRSFTHLIETYKQEQISLKSVGEKAEQIAALPYKIGMGYRVQVFAGSNKGNATKIAEQLQELQLDSVYVMHSPDGLYKVQLGNFTDRKEAEILLDRLRHADVSGSWIVETDIHVPKSTGGEEMATEQRSGVSVTGDAFYYAIQVFATNDRSKALELGQSLEKEFQQPIKIYQQQSIWKVVVGRFSQRSAAEDFLQLVKQRKFEDAWITQIAASS